MVMLIGTKECRSKSGQQTLQKTESVSHTHTQSSSQNAEHLEMVPAREWTANGRTKVGTLAWGV